MMNAMALVMTRGNHEALGEMVFGAARGTHGRDERELVCLERELRRAQVVPCRDIPRDVTTMNSVVQAREPGSARRLQLTLSWPAAADPEAGRVSVLAPMGLALLGARVGQTIQWSVPGGQAALKIEAVVYQPESDGAVLEFKTAASALP